MKITWFGTASILIEPEAAQGDPDKRLLFDPFLEWAGGENPNSYEDFAGETNICITHGHLDHLYLIPAILEQPLSEEEENCLQSGGYPFHGADATVYCTQTPADTLASMVTDTSNIVLIRPGLRFSISDMDISVLPGKHTQFDLRLIRHTLLNPKLLRHFGTALKIGYLHRHYPENKETVAYEIKCEGKRILLLGSLALREDYEYPTGADLLILPFQGRSNVAEAALKIVERLSPKRILLDHFDDAFPPISHSVDTRSFKRLMDQKYPHIQVVKPKAGKPVHL